MPTVTVGDLTIYYEVLGRGEPLLMIMGLASNLLDWGSVVPARLAERYQVILFDNRGAGRTSQPQGPYTMAQMADDTAGLLDALDIERVHVFGASMGGMIAQHFALDHADRLNKLILGCTTPGGPHSVIATPEVLSLLTPRPDLDPLEAGRYVWPTCYTPEFIAGNQTLLEERLQEHLRYPTQLHAYQAQTGAIFSTHDTYDRLPLITAPTLVLTGTRDVLVPPENSRILAERIPNAQLHEIDGAAHVFMVSHADETVTATTAFLS